MALITKVEQLEDLVQYYLKQDGFAFDVETIGDDRSNPLTAKVCWLSMATDGRTDVIPLGHPNGELISEGPALLKTGEKKIAAGKSRSELKPTDFSRNKIERVWGPPPEQLDRGEAFPILEELFSSDLLKVAHNIRFDLHATAKYMSGYPEPPYFDTLIASWLLDVTRTGKLGLEDCMEREFGVILEKGVGKDVSQHAFSTVEKYARLDAEAAWNLYKDLKIQLSRQPEMQWLMDLEMEVLLPVLEMESTGVLIDRDRLKKIDDELRDSIDGLRSMISMFSGRIVNPRSNKQKQELLFGPKEQGGLGLTPIKPTPSAKDIPEESRDVYSWAVDHETLEHYRDTRVVSMLIQHSAKDKLHGTYVLPYLGGLPVRDEGEVCKYIPSRLRNGRIYGQFRQFGTESGRFSSREPNLQNIPSRSAEGKKLREVFISDPGTLLVVADYSQIEPRIIASLSGDKTLIATYRDGGDVYEVVAERVGVTRPIGKELVLAISYGVGADKIASRIGCTPNEARDLMTFFADKFKAIPVHKNRVVALARKNQYSTTIFGRRRPLPRLGWMNQTERSAAERQAYNHLIQGSAADIMKIALVNIHAALPDGAKMLMTVHDEVVVQAPEQMVSTVEQIIAAEMEEARPPLIVVPLVADVHSGRSWGEAKG